MSGIVVRVLFFYKQKTAYEMRISDWSSDVCSSDLQRRYRLAAQIRGAPIRTPSEPGHGSGRYEGAHADSPGLLICKNRHAGRHHARVVGDRKSVVWGKSVSVRVDLGGRRFIKKNTNLNAPDRYIMTQHLFIS